MERIRILLVDDDRMNSELLRKFLEVEGYEVEYAENGRVGWEMFTLPAAPTWYYSTSTCH